MRSVAAVVDPCSTLLLAANTLSRVRRRHSISSPCVMAGFKVLFGGRIRVSTKEGSRLALPHSARQADARRWLFKIGGAPRNEFMEGAPLIDWPALDDRQRRNYYCLTRCGRRRPASGAQALRRTLSRIPTTRYHHFTNTKPRHEEGIQRRGDSRYAGFRDRCLQPLGHLSKIPRGTVDQLV